MLQNDAESSSSIFIVIRFERARAPLNKLSMVSVASRKVREGHILRIACFCVPDWRGYENRAEILLPRC